MRFFDLTHPYYESDQEDSKHNPVRIQVKYAIPGIKCRVCGEQWASSDRVRIVLSAPESLFNFPDILPAEDCFATIQKCAEILNVSPVVLSPGAQIGPPQGEILKDKLDDFIHPFPGQIWVKPAVVDALHSINASGIRFVKVEAFWSNKLKGILKKKPELWELVVTGHAWRVGMDIDKITVCKCCGRKIFPEPEVIEVDEARWDGSDFFNVDCNPNIVIVTERVCEALAKCKFTNYKCIPVP
jgi:hypothetical protein